MKQVHKTKIMDENFLQQLQQKRVQMKKFAEAALEKKWLQQDEFAQIIEKIDNDVLTIGVIGQMKSGKSTFLNALLFGKEILPAATTPMTAALSVITYGETERIEVEFYTENEWSEMRMMANRELSDGNGDKDLESKIKAAKELVEKSEILGSSLQANLGKFKDDSLDNLIQYVGADGKFVSITKSVTIYHPTEWLKGVKIVDTPGFNDPVVSREERTQEFLKFADVVVLLLYAGRAFDSTDRAIIFERVRSVGIGKVLIAINKYDINYAQGETIEEMVSNVKSEIKKAVDEHGDPQMKTLLKDIEPIPMSASMQLLSKLSMDEIMRSENHKFHWDRLTDCFEISTQAQMRENSLTKNLEDAIVSTIEKDKMEILVKKPVAYILQKGENKKNDIENKLANVDKTLQILELPDEEVQTKIKELERTQKKISDEIENTCIDLKEEYNKKLRKIKNLLEDHIAEGSAAIGRIISSGGTFKHDKTQREVYSQIDDILERQTRRKIEVAELEIRQMLLAQTEVLSDRITYFLNKYVESPEDLIKSFQRHIKKIENNSLVNNQLVEPIQEKNKWEKLFKGIKDDLAGIIFEHKSWRDSLREHLSDYIKILKDKLSEINNNLEKKVKQNLHDFNDEALKHILSDITMKLNSASSDENEKEKQILKTKTIQAELKVEMDCYKSEIKEMQDLKYELAL